MYIYIMIIIVYNYIYYIHVHAYSDNRDQWWIPDTFCGARCEDCRDTSSSKEAWTNLVLALIGGMVCLLPNIMGQRLGSNDSTTETKGGRCDAKQMYARIYSRYRKIKNIFQKVITSILFLIPETCYKTSTSLGDIETNRVKTIDKNQWPPGRKARPWSDAPICIVLMMI